MIKCFDSNNFKENYVTDDDSATINKEVLPSFVTWVTGNKSGMAKTSDSRGGLAIRIWV